MPWLSGTDRSDGQDEIDCHAGHLAVCFFGLFTMTQLASAAAQQPCPLSRTLLRASGGQVVIFGLSTFSSLNVPNLKAAPSTLTVRNLPTIRFRPASS